LEGCGGPGCSLGILQAAEGGKNGMRVNVYKEEWNQEIEVVTKTPEGKKLYGLRFYLESSPKLHNVDGDKDTSAVTFWEESPEKLLELLSRARSIVERFKPK
jgi:hypothetical protein